MSDGYRAVEASPTPPPSTPSHPSLWQELKQGPQQTRRTNTELVQKCHKGAAQHQSFCGVAGLGACLPFLLAQVGVSMLSKPSCQGLPPTGPAGSTYQTAAQCCAQG